MPRTRTHSARPPGTPPGTPPQVAAYLQKSVGTLANWRYQGTGPAYTKAGGTVLYMWDDVDAWLASQAVDPAASRTG